MSVLLSMILQKLLVPALVALAERLVMGLFGWLKERDAAALNIALGEQKARADRLAAEARLNKERQDAEDLARTQPDDVLRDRLRATLGRGPVHTGSGRAG